jgi:carbon-monoxide dehydrogenase medium subunit
VKPAAFRYVRAASRAEALEALAAHGDEAKTLAGGQSLVPLMNLRLARPGVLVDLNAVDDLAGIAVRDGAIAIGAMTRHRDVAASAELATACPLLPAAAAHVGYPAIRVRGTLGGSLAHADPVAELPCAILALGAEVVAERAGEVRTLTADELFVDYYTTALEPDELLTEVRVRPLGPGEGHGFRELSRKTGDYALAAAGVRLWLDGGRVGAVRVALAGVSARPVRATDVEGALIGEEPTPAALDAAAGLAAGAVTLRDDPRAGARFRRQLATTLTRRALADAVAAAEAT